MKYLPCPFCGKLEQEVIEELFDDKAAIYGYGWAVYCSCGAQGAVGLTEEKAIALWNTRANAPVQQEIKSEIVQFVSTERKRSQAG